MTTAASTPSPRVLIVTGASAGIGAALARAAARDDYAVLAIARRAERLGALAAAIAAAGGRAATLALDVTAADAPQRIVATALETFGAIDVLINNAGTGALGALLDIDDAALAAQWELHVAAPLRIARAARPALRARGGALIFLGSGLARVPIPNYGAYALAKAAIRAAATQLRRELRAEGIAVGYVDPGLVATEFHATLGIERTRGLRALDPDRVARAILRGVARRRASIAGSALQRAGTVLAEWAGPLLDEVAVQLAPTSPAPVVPPPPPPVAAPVTPAGVGVDAALAPVARRMERVKLSAGFVRDALVPGATLELNELAMRWAGMPNKNERAALREVLEQLEGAGYLQREGEDSWSVTRAAD